MKRHEKTAADLKAIARNIRHTHKELAAGFNVLAAAVADTKDNRQQVNTHRGNYTNLVFLNQCLYIVLTHDGREELTDLIERANDRNEESDLIFRDLLEEHTCNSAADWLRPEDVGGLTGAPILGEEVGTADDGTITTTGRVYWFVEYQTTDPAKELRRAGYLQFTGVPNNGSEETDPAKQEAKADAAALAEVLQEFEKTAREKMKQARKCGALDKGAPPIFVAKCAVIIAAEVFMPPPYYAAELRNLRKFI